LEEGLERACEELREYGDKGMTSNPLSGGFLSSNKEIITACGKHNNQRICNLNRLLYKIGYSCEYKIR
jgi:hypothetical protein